MIRLGELELIFRLNQINPQLPALWAGILTSWTNQIPGSTLNSHPNSSNTPPEAIRLSFLSSQFNLHVSLNQIHLHFIPQLENDKISNFLFNFYNNHTSLIKDISQNLQTDIQLRVIGKVFYPFKQIFSNPQDLIKILHQGFVSFPPLGSKTTNFQLQCGYEDKNHLFKFIFHDYQLRKINLPPGSKITPLIIAQAPVIENGLEVALDLTHLPSSRSIEGELVNLLRLFALNIDSLPSNFFNNLLGELKTSGPTFN